MCNRVTFCSGHLPRPSSSHLPPAHSTGARLSPEASSPAPPTAGDPSLAGAGRCDARRAQLVDPGSKAQILDRFRSSAVDDGEVPKADISIFLVKIPPKRTDVDLRFDGTNVGPPS